MPITDLRLVSGAVSAVRAARRVALDGNDFTDERGFIVQAATSGTLTFRPLDAEQDLSFHVTGGYFPSVCGIAVLCSAIRGTSAVQNVLIAYL